MLYDPKWDKQAETKADPFTLESLIAWLEGQPSETTYDFCKRQTCLVAQYLKAQGVERYDLRSYEIPPAFLPVVHPLFGQWTFGAALERARAALSSTDRTEP